MLGRLAPLLEAAPPTHPPLTPPTPLTPQSCVGPNSPQLSPRELPSQAPKNHCEGAQAQPLSLEEDIKQFEEKYANLVVHVRDAFKRGKVSFTQLQDCLLQLPVSLKLQCGKFLQSQASDLFQASSIDVLFIILSLQWDFLNPSLLAHLVQRFGDEQTKKSIDKYLGELKTFRMQTKISDFIDKWTGTPLPVTRKIVVELDDKLTGENKVWNSWRSFESRSHVSVV